MAFTVAQGSFLIVALMLIVSIANGGSGPETSIDVATNARKIIVGGPDRWHHGFDYSDWAAQNYPFYVNDVLVFKYDPQHSVYLLPDFDSFEACDLSRGKLIANPRQGGGQGFEFVLDSWLKQYYFVCGEHGGVHCRDGKMKFMAVPKRHP